MQRIELYNKVPISTWEHIVSYINKLQLSECSEEEFAKNLETLHNLLVYTNVCLDDGARKADCLWKIGIATLLQTIYDLQAKGNAQEQLTRQIQTLKDIGVDKIQFYANTYEKAFEIINLYLVHKQEYIFLSKVYTDGAFKIANFDNYKHMFTMQDITDANYLLEVALNNRHGKNKSRIVATLNNFEGIYPNKEEIMALRMPTLENGAWHLSPRPVKQLINGRKK